MTPTTITTKTDPVLISENHQEIAKEAFRTFIDDASFPCVAAKAALNRDQMKLFVAGHIACPKDDRQILEFIYDFVDSYRNAENHFHTACVIFPDAGGIDEMMFERLLWMRLQALSDLDGENYPYDQRVSPDPQSDQFSFSLKEEAFFVIGLNPASSRPARRFKISGYCL
ncbi:YqcI/YcgG family protein [Chryseobacterium sp. SORGH_AS_1175]|uniref:YqcI/YcgG family protein n=1 Tax=Chryseobacterium sp. SORGH_AS_1175 TaxID=3041760 RepID=UPI00286A06DD|nr:YqcI/YcgG family protein [Chryseobacterium sp. SORGH_AS_1175]